MTLRGETEGNIEQVEGTGAGQTNKGVGSMGLFKSCACASPYTPTVHRQGLTSLGFFLLYLLPAWIMCWRALAEGIGRGVGEVRRWAGTAAGRPPLPAAHPRLQLLMGPTGCAERSR